MTDTTTAPRLRTAAVPTLLGLYCRVTAWYLALVFLFAYIGVESIYRHPTPFHALLFPAGDSWTGPVFMLGLVGASVLVVIRYLAGPGALNPHRIALVTGSAFIWLFALARVLTRDDALVSGDSTMWEVLWTSARWHLPSLVIGVAFAVLAGRWFRTHPDVIGPGPLTPMRPVVITLFIFAVLFSAGVAMIRGGMDGISHAYQRESYEYIGDIGLRTGIRIFLRDYNELHAYLSMHSKVHPPGPVVILWVMSSVLFSRSPTVLSWATIVAGSTAVVPLFLWVRDMLGRRTAILSTVLYVLMPSIVLFTATSADILFMPLTLWTLFLFWRAMHWNSWKYAMGAGALYAVISLCSFSLLGIGAFFGFAGLWRLREPHLRVAVVRTAALMIAAFLAVHLVVYYWSGFDVVECFRLSKAQFDEDQANLDIYTPRYPGWVFTFLNPMAMFFFAGIPVSVLFCLRLVYPVSEESPAMFSDLLRAPSKPLFIVFALTLLVLNLLYLGRGEGERSAMYVLPFIVIPAGHYLYERCMRAGSVAPAAMACGFLAVQCWAIESCLYTYW